MTSKKSKPPRIPEFKDPSDVIKYMRDLMQLNLDKKLPNGTLHVQTNAVNSLLRVLIPREPMQITQQIIQPQFDLSKLKDDEQALLARAIAKLEASTSPS